MPAFFSLCSDPRVWAHYPELRHTQQAETVTMVSHWDSSWESRKVGLTLVHRGPDAGNPDAAAIRLVFADRALSDEQLAAATL